MSQHNKQAGGVQQTVYVTCELVQAELHTILMHEETSDADNNRPVERTPPPAREPSACAPLELLPDGRCPHTSVLPATIHSLTNHASFQRVGPECTHVLLTKSFYRGSSVLMQPAVQVV